MKEVCANGHDYKQKGCVSCELLYRHSQYRITVDQDTALLKQQIEFMKDALQAAFNSGAFICRWRGIGEKPADHWHWCLPCRVRHWLTPGHYLRPDVELRSND